MDWMLALGQIDDGDYRKEKEEGRDRKRERKRGKEK